jgi:uncharacterized protein YgbK (DUF1537 family)
MLTAELLASLPPPWPAELLPEIQAQVTAAGVKIVVLDDDPTGTQTVHDVDVLTGWSEAELRAALRQAEPVIYVLTNSRSLPGAAAAQLTRELATNLRAASQAIGRPFAVVSRSDSTLRGHYPIETDVLAEILGPFDGLLLIPFFLEGGRLTSGNLHYMTAGERLMLAGETEFARDAAFGYRSSDLRAWVAEKTGGAIRPEQVQAISLTDLRVGGPDAVAAQLATLADGQPCVVNAVAYRDLEVLVAGLLRAEQRGQRFIYRTAASFVRVRGGLVPATPLRPDDLWRTAADRGGLVVVGSHVARSTEQLQAALTLPDVVPIEARVSTLLGAATRAAELARLAAETERALLAGRDAVVHTSRELVTGGDAASSLAIGQRLSAALVELVAGLRVAPAWVIAKGGITSSDLASKALRVRRARVLGQAIAGVPVWALPDESLWPHTVYVVFPGNVGGPTALADMMAILRHSPLAPQPEV